MKIRQWEIWKGKPDGFERAHWFVILSGNERCDSTRHALVNGLACFSLRGQPLSTEVRLNGADGLRLPQYANAISFTRCEKLRFTRYWVQ